MHSESEYTYTYHYNTGKTTINIHTKMHCIRDVPCPLLYCSFYSFTVDERERHYNFQHELTDLFEDFQHTHKIIKLYLSMGYRMVLSAWASMIAITLWISFGIHLLKASMRWRPSFLFFIYLFARCRVIVKNSYPFSKLKRIPCDRSIHLYMCSRHSCWIRI